MTMKKNHRVPRYSKYVFTYLYMSVPNFSRLTKRVIRANHTNILFTQFSGNHQSNLHRTNQCKKC